jgi:hypothetical protein
MPNGSICQIFMKELQPEDLTEAASTSHLSACASRTDTIVRAVLYQLDLKADRFSEIGGYQRPTALVRMLRNCRRDQLRPRRRGCDSVRRDHFSVKRMT